MNSDIEDLHNVACGLEKSSFLHPETGFSVMTAHGLRKQKRCCGNKCLFCPFGHENVKHHTCTSNGCPFQMHQPT